MSDALPTTVGFEAEFEAGAAEVIQELSRRYGRPIVASNELHRYHCDCDDCGMQYTFRGQTDSSCSGEIISNIFYEWDVMVAATDCLQAVATDMDAVPGYSSGFHVHVGRPANPDARRAAFFEILRYEHALNVIAAGRFGEQRDNNQPLHNTLLHGLTTAVDGPWRTGNESEWYQAQPVPRLGRFGTVVDFGAGLEWIRHHPTMQSDYKQILHDYQRDADRHSNLNLRTRYPTWEFRFFNSTRSAWRMQMWCGLSAAFIEPRFVAHLMNTDGIPSRRVDGGVSDLIEALTYINMDRTAELVQRQMDYWTKVQDSELLVPSEFAVL